VLSPNRTPSVLASLIPLLHAWLPVALAMAVFPSLVLAQDRIHESSVEGKAGPRAHFIYVVGAVMRPGGYLMPQQGKISFLQALAFAGGIDVTGITHSAVIIRQAEDGHRLEIQVNLGKVIKGRAPDINLVEGDIVFVLDSRKRKQPAGPRDLPSPFIRRA